MKRIDQNEIEVIRSDARLLGADLEKNASQIAQVVSDARLILIGEASHGTAEFYRFRAKITQQLIQHHGFQAVAAEADWPDALEIHRHVTAVDSKKTLEQAFHVFERFPVWMWRNEEVFAFAQWLRRFNETLLPMQRCGFFGIDLYSLRASMQAVLGYLNQRDSSAASRAKERYACFDHFHGDPQWYGLTASASPKESCEDDVVSQLIELQKQARELISRDGQFAIDEQFYAEQNARVVVNAEKYYRNMYRGSVSSWNLRDTHMTKTITELLDHLQKTRGQSGKCVVWAHNSHLGDARATQMGTMGEVNVGQLLREQFPGEVINIGFTTYTGTVTAASEWDAPAETMQVRPALSESYEWLFHETGLKQFWLDFRKDQRAASALMTERLERAIGVVYRPHTELQSHYFYTRLPEQFDLIIHLDETTAVKPLKRRSVHHAKEDYPETYPVGQ